MSGPGKVNRASGVAGWPARTASSFVPFDGMLAWGRTLRVSSICGDGVVFRRPPSALPEMKDITIKKSTGPHALRHILTRGVFVSGIIPAAQAAKSLANKNGPRHRPAADNKHWGRI